MDFFKRAGLYLGIFLLLVSVYKDLSKGSNFDYVKDHHDQDLINDQSLFRVIKVEVHQGDTVLSIVEKINNGRKESLNIEEILADFKVANPKVNPFQLVPGDYYYFPLYD